MHTKSYRPWAPEQPFLLPPSPRDWLPENHLALFLLRVVERLDLSPIHAAHAAKDPRGERPYSPVMLVVVLLYAYCTGTFSSRRIERATYEDVAFRVIAGGNHPDHATIARFRRAYFDVLAGLFVQVVQLCQSLGLVDVSRVALDGTRVQGSASKHKAMSYERMGKKRSELEEQIEALLAHAEAVDAEEDALYGEDRNGLLRELPAELKRRQDQLAAIETAMAALEQGAREARAEHLQELAAQNDIAADDPSRSPKQRKAAASRARKQRKRAEALRAEDDDRDDDDPPTGQTSLFPSSVSEKSPDRPAEPSPEDLPEHRVKHHANAKPHPKAQRNFTDPDSAIMGHQGGFVQGYNCQVVATEGQFIVAQGASNVAPDNHHLPPMVERVRATCGEVPDVLLADAGYWAPENAAYCEDHRVDAYISMAQADPSASTGAGPPATERERMRAKVDSDQGKDRYKARKWMVEPVFGQIKEAMRFRRFSVRGLDLARAEWAFVCACHDLLKLWRAQALPA